VRYKEEKGGVDVMKKSTTTLTKSGLPIHASRLNSRKICTHTELRQQIHDDVRKQHPEWVEPNGESPMCDFYEARLMELLHFDAKGLN
jgi:hypothetical protein